MFVGWVFESPDKNQRGKDGMNGNKNKEVFGKVINYCFFCTNFKNVTHKKITLL
jgi:hypothetical protein